MTNNSHTDVISTDEFVDWNRINKSKENDIKQELDSFIANN